MRLFLIGIIFILLVQGCTPKKENTTFKKSGEITIQDKDPYLGELYSIKFVDKDHFFTYDSRANIEEFKNYKFVKVWGKTGEGPCEHGSLNDFTVYQDSLFMLDREQGKYLAYGASGSAKTNCKETFNDTVVRLSAIQIIAGTPFLIRGTLVKSLAANTPVIYKVDEKSRKISPISDIRLKDLGINLIGIPIRLSMASAKKDKKLLFYLPLTKKVFIYDTEDNKLKSVGVDLYMAEDQGIYEEKDIQKLSTLLSDKIEIVLNIFALKNDFALGYRKGTGEHQVWGLKVFDYDGNKIAEEKFKNRVIYMDNKELMTLNLNTDKQQNPYSFIVYKYSLE